MPPILAFVGAACLTSIFRVAAWPSRPGKVLAETATQVADGMSVSAAAAAARLGAVARWVGRIGDDAGGRRTRDDIAAAGVDVSGARLVAGGRSSFATAIVDAAGERYVFPYHDPALDASPAWIDLGRLLSGAAFLHAEVRWPEGAAHVMAAAQARGVPTMLDADTAPQGVLDRLLPLATHKVFSDAALLAHTGAATIEAGLRAVPAAPGEHVGASAGAAGYYWLDGRALRHAPAPRVVAVDTLAAGDVFHGALAFALAEGRAMETAARFACAAATLKCTRFGGRLGAPTRDEVAALLTSPAGRAP
jgi:sulfofructose kinase